MPLKEPAMHTAIAEKRESLADLCRRFGVARLEVFGSAARGVDFDEGASDVDFLVEFRSSDDELTRFVAFKEALEFLLERSVDLVDRKAIEASRNYIRKRHILTGAEPIYAV
jgi:uncharacterized protein